MATAFRLESEGQSLVLCDGNPSGDDPIWITSYNLGYPSPRVVAGQYAGQSGKYDLTYLHDDRQVTFELKVNGDGTLTSREQIHAQLSEMCHPANRLSLYIYRSDFDQERVMQLRADPLTTSVSQISAAYYEIALQFSCLSGLMDDTIDVGVSIPASSTAQGFFLPQADYANNGISALRASGTGLAIPAANYTPDGISSPVTTGFFLSQAPPGSSHDLDNDGNVSTSPVMAIYGAITNPIIRNDTTGQILDFSANGGLTILDGQWLEIDVQDRTVYMNSDPDYSYYSKINWATSSWWDLQKGTNTIALTGSGIGANAQLAISFTRHWI